MAGCLEMSANRSTRERKGTPGQRQSSIPLSHGKGVGLAGLNGETTPHGNLFRLQIRRNLLISLLTFSVYSGKMS